MKMNLFLELLVRRNFPAWNKNKAFQIENSSSSKMLGIDFLREEIKSVYYEETRVATLVD